MTQTITGTQYVEHLRGDLRFFVHELWRFHGLDKVAPLSDLEYDILHWLQNGPSRRGVIAFRGEGKSYQTNAFVAWRLLNDPELKVLLVSASQTKSRDNLRQIRTWIYHTPFLQHLRQTGDGLDSADKFDVGGIRPAKNPSIAAFGITGQITGHRAGLIVPDDVETPETAMTREMRVKLRERVKEFDSILLPKGQTVYLGTYQNEESIYLDLAKSGYAFRSWPARYPMPGDALLNFSPTLQRKLDKGEAKPGEPTAPLRFNSDDLSAREASVGRSTFAMQFLLHTNLSNALLYPLKMADFIVHPVHPAKAPRNIAWGKHAGNNSTAVKDVPGYGLADDCCYGPIYVDSDWLPYHGTKMFIDPSGGKNNDETAWAIVGQLHGYLYIKRVSAYRGPHSTENLASIASDALHHRVNDIIVEDNYGGTMLAQLLKPAVARLFIEANSEKAKELDLPHGWAATVEPLHVTGQKELRIINTLEPVMNQHRLVADPSVVKDEVLMTQLTRITRQRNCLKHDDRIDALAGAVGLFTELMDQDAARTVKQIDAREYRRHLRLSQPRAGHPPEPAWARL